MKTSPNYYCNVLEQELVRRKAKNAKYSLRSFARDLGMDVAALSRVLSQKGSLTLVVGKKIARILKLSAVETKNFLESIADQRKFKSLKNEVVASKLEIEGIQGLEEDQFALISKLYHYAILELSKTDDFDSEPKTIAKALGITVIEAREAIDRLLRLGLLKKNGSKLEKTSAYITTKNKSKTSKALRNHQREIMQNALFRMENEPIEKRIVSGMTIPIDPEKLPLARQLIDEFSQKMAEIMSSGKRQSVYQLQISFCSLMALRNT